MKLFIIRHGETVENRENITQGWLPGKLTEKGKEQLRRAALRLQNHSIDIIYTSDLERCVASARIIAAFHPQTEIVQNTLLREWGRGIFEGRKKESYSLDTLPGDELQRRPPGGETVLEVYERVHKFYQQHISTHGEKCVVIVSHGCPIVALKSILFKNDMRTYFTKRKPGNGTITEVNITKNGVKTVTLDCNKHLLLEEEIHHRIQDYI